LAMAKFKSISVDICSFFEQLQHFFFFNSMRLYRIRHSPYRRWRKPDMKESCTTIKGRISTVWLTTRLPGEELLSQLFLS
jgi:hypothetical protein